MDEFVFPLLIAFFRKALPDNSARIPPGRQHALIIATFRKHFIHHPFIAQKQIGSDTLRAKAKDFKLQQKGFDRRSVLVVVQVDPQQIRHLGTHGGEQITVVKET